MIRDITKSLKILLFVYVGALFMSWVIQIYFPTSDKLNAFQQRQIITVESGQVDYSYLSLGNQQSHEVLVLLPDLFGGTDFLLPLAGSLSDSLKVIIPEYPTQTIENQSLSYSVKSRAAFTSVLLDSLDVSRIHLIGHGYGGLLAIDLASTKKSDFESLILLSSYGPQELQFLGNHLINRSLYSVLYPVVTFFKYLVPHMGWFHEQPVDFDFANTLIALDQRPVRDQLKKIEIPVHILQPLNDRYISISIAEEIHRIVPHSSILLESGDHLSPKENPAIWSSHILRFIDAVNKRLVAERDNAESARIQASEEPFDAEMFETVGGWTLTIIIILLVIISLFSEDLACVAGGLLVASGIIDFWYAVLGPCIGVLGADVIIYALGKWIGNPILQWVPFRWFIKEEDIIRAEKMYRMRGVEIIFATRFLPGTRLPVYLVSGMIRVKFTFFLLYFILSMIIWAPLLVGVSALVGQPMIAYLASYQEHALWLVPIILMTIYLISRGVILISTTTGRRKIVVKFGRFRERFFEK